MKRDASGAGPSLSAVFVDYDNIYLSLRRKNEDAAKRFAKDAAAWLKAIELGTLITPTNSGTLDGPRRIVMNRCYGNPVPRRNQGDNSTDMTSFPFVRHHFLRAGFEIVDCPPLTQQLKNSSDIRMVMDVRDYLHHDTYFDEFIILSGDADFTPVLHRLRAHARRTVIFANDYTAAPYTAISDGEIREADLIKLLLTGLMGGVNAPITTTTHSETTPPQMRANTHPAATAVQAAGRVQPQPVKQPQTPHISDAPEPDVSPASSQIQQARSVSSAQAAARTAVAYQALAPVAEAPKLGPLPLRLENYRDVILNTIVDVVRSANGPVAIETLADRAVRALGQDKTAGTNWAGAGSFRGFLLQNLPPEIRMTEQSPYFAYDVERHGTPDEEPAYSPSPPQPEPPTPGPTRGLAGSKPDQLSHVEVRHARLEQGRAVAALAPVRTEIRAEPVAPPVAAQATHTIDSGSAAAIQQAVARIFEACQAPPLGPLEYRLLFELLAAELNENKISGAQTLTNVLHRATEQKLRVTRDDIRFVFDVVSEVDPWFEQGASASLFAGRFRNFVVARCRTQGLSLSADDIDLIDRLFTGGPTAGQRQPVQQPARSPQPPQLQETGWGGDMRRASAAPADAPFGENSTGTDDFPRIVKSRMRG